MAKQTKNNSSSKRVTTRTRTRSAIFRPDYYGNRHFYDPFKGQRNTHRFLVCNIFPRGDAIPVFTEFTQDDLALKKQFSTVEGYFSPSKTRKEKTKHGSPCLVTLTPRHRQFKSIANFSIRRQAFSRQLEFFQEPGNSKERVKKYPPVIRKMQEEEVERTLEDPIGDMKQVQESWVTEEKMRRARDERRYNPKTLFGNTSGNEIFYAFQKKKLAEESNTRFNENFHEVDKTKLDEKYVLSHLMPTSFDKKKDKRKYVVVTPEGHNFKRVPIEFHPADLISKGKVPGLYYSSEVNLQKDKKGRSTHIAGNLEVTLWQSPNKTTSIKAELNPQNPELPTLAFHKMTKHMVEEAFSNSGTSQEDTHSSDSSTDCDPVPTLAVAPVPSDSQVSLPNPEDKEKTTPSFSI